VKTTSVLLLLTACLSFAAQPALTSSDAVSPSRTAVKLYYGAYGSSDYVSGTTSQSPTTDDGWQFHSEMPGRMMDHVVATDGEYIYATAAYGTLDCPQ
jgi:hypothetical protein